MATRTKAKSSSTKAKSRKASRPAMAEDVEGSEGELPAEKHQGQPAGAAKPAETEQQKFEKSRAAAVKKAGSLTVKDLSVIITAGMMTIEPDAGGGVRIRAAIAGGQPRYFHGNDLAEALGNMNNELEVGFPTIDGSIRREPQKLAVPVQGVEDYQPGVGAKSRAGHALVKDEVLGPMRTPTQGKGRQTDEQASAGRAPAKTSKAKTTKTSSKAKARK